jgi:hypothetical protein
MLFTQRICNKRENLVYYRKKPSKIVENEDIYYLKIAYKKGRKMNAYPGRYVIDIAKESELILLKYLYFIGENNFRIRWNDFLPFDHNHEILKEILSLGMTEENLPAEVCKFAGYKNMKLIWSFYFKKISSLIFYRLLENLVRFHKKDFIIYLMSGEVWTDKGFCDIGAMCLDLAIIYDYFDLFQYIIECDSGDAQIKPLEVYENIIKYDRIEMFELFITYEPDDYIFHDIVDHDRLEMFKEFVNVFTDDYSSVVEVDYLVFHKRISMIDYLIEEEFFDAHEFIKCAEKNKNRKLANSLTKKYLQ